MFDRLFILYNLAVSSALTLLTTRLPQVFGVDISPPQLLRNLGTFLVSAITNNLVGIGGVVGALAAGGIIASGFAGNRGPRDYAVNLIKWVIIGVVALSAIGGVITFATNGITTGTAGS